MTGLIIEKNYIDGEWVGHQETIAVTNPATGETLGHIPKMSAAEVEKAIAAAHAAFPSWSAKTVYERAEIMRKWGDLIARHKDDIAKIITQESGKPLKEALGEVHSGNIDWSAEEAKRAYGRNIPTPVAGRDIMVIKQPIGVSGMITPWNFPFSMITRKVSPALAAGCTVVLKPDDQTPFTALALARLAEEAGLPKGVLNIITGDAPTIGKILTTHDKVRKISFTGSTRVGKLLMAQASETVKKVSLELGGNAPFIVFDSADMDVVIKSMLEAKIRNAGQTCVCPNRAYVHNTRHDEFVTRLTEEFKKLKIGNGLEDGVQVGPLINAKGLEKVERLVTRALDAGAKVVVGGKRHALGGTFYEPTILTGIKPEMEISCEEIFGPVVAVQKFTDENDVIRQANDTTFGLASYFFTSDLRQMQRVSKALEYGMVGVNTGMMSFACAPFGGVKQSGIGRECGTEGVEEYLETKYIAVQS